VVLIDNLESSGPPSVTTVWVTGVKIDHVQHLSGNEVCDYYMSVHGRKVNPVPGNVSVVGALLADVDTAFWRIKTDGVFLFKA
jgi:hypothetical protein